MSWLKRPEVTDWMAEYNKALEAQGEDSTIGCLRHRPSEGKSLDVQYSNTRIDGIGAMTEGLKSIGYASEEIPEFKYGKEPSRWKLWPELIGFLLRELQPIRPLPWIYRRPEKPYTTYGKCFQIFDVAETRALQTKARAQGGNYTTLLLHGLNRAVNECLLERPSLNRWHIPVNVRGLHGDGSEKKNYLSNFLQEIGPESSVSQILKEQFRQLRRGSFHATFFFLNIGDFYGLKNVLPGKVSKAYQKPRCSERVTGTFSSIGSWPKPTAKDHHPDEVLIPYGNVSLKNPICALNMLWWGKLTVSLQVHSSVVAGQAEAENLMKRWMENVRK